MDTAFLLSLLGAILGAASILLHVVAPRTKTTVDDTIRDDVDKLLAFMNGQTLAAVVKPAAKPPAGSGTAALLAVLLFGALAAPALAGCAAARPAVAAGVIAALDCEDGHIDAAALADAKAFADAKLLQWLAGAVAPSSAAIKADLAPIKSDLGKCAITGVVAAAAAAAAPTPGTAVSALTGPGATAAAVQAQFSIAARQLGWAPVKVAGGTVL